MRWFRKNGEAPRLLSLSPLRTEGSEAERPSGPQQQQQQQVRHRSRIGKKNNNNTSCVNPSHMNILDMSPSMWPRHHNSKNETNLYNVGESIIIVEKSDRRSRNKSKGRENTNSHSREKRNPLLDRVKHTRLSCFRSSVSSQVDVPSSSGIDNLLTDDDSSIYDSLPRSSCLAAKLRAMSEKYLQSSTNKFLTKLYKHQEPSSPHLAESTPSKSGKKKLVRAKLRSFSYGTLPGLDEFQKKHNPLFHDDDTQLLGDDDSDSGILLNDSGSSSILDAPLVETRNTSLHQQRNNIITPKERRKCVDEAPTLPAKAPTARRKEIRLVRLLKGNANDELGILIAKGTNPGYVIADILPGSLAQRYK